MHARKGANTQNKQNEGQSDPTHARTNKENKGYIYKKRTHPTQTQTRRKHQLIEVRLSHSKASTPFYPF